MTETKQIVKLTPYANRDDFRQVFEEDMSGLYLLSFLLTTNHEKAEQCFVSGLEDAVDGNPVFKEWARSWARRMIIVNAVRAVNPRPAEENVRSSSASVSGSGRAISAEPKVEIAEVLRLEPFERFVYVMTVLERYSDQDCSLLLGCARREVVAGRTRAVERLGSAMVSHAGQASPDGSDKPALDDHDSPLLRLFVGQRLATSA